MSEFNTPSNDDLRVIKQQLGSIRAEAAARSGKPVITKKPSDGEICRICLQNYKIVLNPKNKDKHCAGCTQKLESGMTAIVCVSGRYMFISARAGDKLSKEDKRKVKAMEGQVVRVKIETMDNLMLKHNIENSNAQN